MEKKNQLISELIMLIVIASYASIYTYEVWGMRLIEQKLFVIAISFIMFGFIMIRLISLAVLLIKSKEVLSINVNVFKNSQLVYFLTLVSYVFLIPFLGVFSATFIFLIAFLLLFNIKKTKVLIIFPFVFTLFLYISFKVLLNVRLPKGIFL